MWPLGTPVLKWKLAPRALVMLLVPVNEVADLLLGSHGLRVGIGARAMAGGTAAF